MSTILRICLIVFIVACGYLGFPSPAFPKPPSDSVQSLEEADVEDAHERRAYFTNFSREEVLNHYEEELQKTFPVLFPSYQVSYPPEDAQTLIRDQTRSVHLPEIIHPARESLFVNFFEAQTAKDAISYKGIPYERKITVRYIPTPIIPRILITLPAFLFFAYVARELSKESVTLLKTLFKND